MNKKEWERLRKIREDFADKIRILSWENEKDEFRLILKRIDKLLSKRK